MPIAYCENCLVETSSVFKMNASEDFGKVQKRAYDALKEGDYKAALASIETLLGLYEGTALWQKWCYCAARAALTAGNVELSCDYFKRLHEADGEGRFAQEAFFHCYPLESYQRGDKRAIRQLEELVDRYPFGLYSIYASYLIAEQQSGKAFKTSLKKSSLRSLERAYSCYRKVCEQVEVYLEGSVANPPIFIISSHPTKALVWLRGQSLFQGAQCASVLSQSPILLKRGRWQRRAVTMIEKLLISLRGDTRPLEEWRSQLKLKAMCLRLTLYCQTKQWVEAEELLEKMFKDYAILTAQESWSSCLCLEAIVELCRRSMACHESAYAGRWLERGSSLLKNVGYQEVGLAFLLQRACYLEMLGFDDEAMCTVVKVINSPIASSLRLKAMFYQARLFKKAGKEEQACRAKERAQALVGRCLVEEFEQFL